MKKEKNNLFDQCARLEQGAGGTAPSWLQKIRREAMGRFCAMGLPTNRREDWKYTDVSALGEMDFRSAPAWKKGGLSTNEWEEAALPGWQPNRLVFFNGRCVPELSQLNTLPPGVIVGSLADAIRQAPSQMESYFVDRAGSLDQPFVALNTAFWEDGAYVYLPQGVAVRDPIHFVFISAPGSSGGTIALHPRNLIVAQEGSAATLVESYCGFGDALYFNNPLTQMIAGANAVVDHYKLQRESDRATHIAAFEIHKGHHAQVSSHSISLGGALTRNDVRALLDGGAGGELILNGLAVAQGGQHMDNHTEIDHLKPCGTSRETYLNILGGKSRGVFHGKIFVRQDAQKSNARQTNKNLLLSDEAKVTTQPQLEIYADDVQCRHGATTGQLQEDAIFYLCSRGMDRQAARSLLTWAFANELVGIIKVEALRRQVEKFVLAQLPGGEYLTGVL